MVANIKPPCKECKEKKENWLGCHDVCEKYKKYKKTLDEANLAKKKQYETVYARVGYMSDKQFKSAGKRTNKVFKQHKK